MSNHLIFANIVSNVELNFVANDNVQKISYYNIMFLICKCKHGSRCGCILTIIPPNKMKFV